MSGVFHLGRNRPRDRRLSVVRDGEVRLHFPIRLRGSLALSRPWNCVGTTLSNSLMVRLASVTCLLALLLSSGSAVANSKGLRAFAAPEDVVFDGEPKEFDTDWRPLTKEVRGSAKAGDIEAKATVAFGDDGLYVAADVTDDKLVGGGDHVELLLGIPGGTLASFRMFPGVPGKSRAEVKDKAGRKVTGSKIVEAPRRGGYTLEAFVPWKAVPESSTIRVGYRGGLFVHDADASTTAETVLGSTASQRYAELPAISTMSELALGSGLLRQRNIRSAPRFNLMANVVGDGMLERVLIYDRFLVILGPGYRGGEQYYYRDLGTKDVSKLEVDDFTGDGKADLLLVKRVPGSLGSVEVLEVLSYHAAGETPDAVFAQEVKLSLTSGGTIANEYKVSGKGAGTTIVLSPGKASGLTSADYQRTSSTGATPVLVPWGAIASQTFTVKGGTFALTQEQAQESESAPPPPPPDDDTAVAAAPKKSGPKPPSVTTWTKRQNAPDPEQVYELYKKQRKVQGKPSFDLRADMVGGKDQERLVVHGRDLVIFGPGFRDGRGFSALTLSQFEKASDIRAVTSQDVTGDGLEEIVVRGEIRTPLPEEVGKGQMQREVVLVYKVKGEVLERVFAAEVGRRVGDKRVEARLDFDKKAKKQITLRPGKAVGYTKENYPWMQKTEPDGDFEPLLLPWGGVEKVALRYDGTRFVR